MQILSGNISESVRIFGQFAIIWSLEQGKNWIINPRWQAHKYMCPILE